MSEDIIDAIEHTLYDYSVSMDAMRWTPDPAEEPDRPVSRWIGIGPAAPNMSVNNSGTIYSRHPGSGAWSRLSTAVQPIQWHVIRPAMRDRILRRLRFVSNADQERRDAA